MDAAAIDGPLARRVALTDRRPKTYLMYVYSVVSFMKITIISTLAAVVLYINFLFALGVVRVVFGNFAREHARVSSHLAATAQIVCFAIVRNRKTVGAERVSVSECRRDEESSQTNNSSIGRTYIGSAHRDGWDGWDGRRLEKWTAEMDMM